MVLHQDFSSLCGGRRSMFDAQSVLSTSVMYPDPKWLQLPAARSAHCSAVWSDLRFQEQCTLSICIYLCFYIYLGQYCPGTAVAVLSGLACAEPAGGRLLGAHAWWGWPAVVAGPFSTLHVFGHYIWSRAWNASLFEDECSSKNAKGKRAYL